MKRPGFTLIELLVVTAVFSLLFLIATSVFSGIQTYQRGILAKQRLAADGRYVLENMARMIRTNAIDYDFYGNEIAAVVPRLAIRDKDNQPICFYLDGSGAIVQGTDCTSGEPLTPSDLEVQRFDIIISPRSNPFKPPPTVATDCRTEKYNGIAKTFDPAQGVCRCLNAEDITNCYPDQRCVKPDPNTADFFICQNPSIQPMVTIALQTRNRSTRAGERAQITLQTTISSRVYAY